MKKILTTLFLLIIYLYCHSQTIKINNQKQGNFEVVDSVIKSSIVDSQKVIVNQSNLKNNSITKHQGRKEENIETKKEVNITTSKKLE